MPENHRILGLTELPPDDLSKVMLAYEEDGLPGTYRAAAELFQVPTPPGGANQALQANIGGEFAGGPLATLDPASGVATIYGVNSNRFSSSTINASAEFGTVGASGTYLHAKEKTSGTSIGLRFGYLLPDNYEATPTVGTIIGRMAIYDLASTLIGYIPIYDS